MNDREIAVKNMLLGSEFDKYIVEHPNFVQKIPPDSTIVSQSHLAIKGRTVDKLYIIENN